MYQLTTHASFDSAHFLSGYEGKCSNIHGHRWKLEVTVQSETLEQTGPVSYTHLPPCRLIIRKEDFLINLKDH